MGWTASDYTAQGTGSVVLRREQRYWLFSRHRGRYDEYAMRDAKREREQQEEEEEEEEEESVETIVAVTLCLNTSF